MEFRKIFNIYAPKPTSFLDKKEKNRKINLDDDIDYESDGEPKFRQSEVVIEKVLEDEKSEDDYADKNGDETVIFHLDQVNLAKRTNKNDIYSWDDGQEPIFEKPEVQIGNENKKDEKKNQNGQLIRAKGSDLYWGAVEEEEFESKMVSRSLNDQSFAKPARQISSSLAKRKGNLSSLQISDRQSTTPASATTPRIKFTPIEFEDDTLKDIVEKRNPISLLDMNQKGGDDDQDSKFLDEASNKTRTEGRSKSRKRKLYDIHDYEKEISRIETEDKNILEQERKPEPEPVYHEVKNQELQSDQWLNSVIWDPKQNKHSVPFILDTNDCYMHYVMEDVEPENLQEDKTDKLKIEEDAWNSNKFIFEEASKQDKMNFDKKQARKAIVHSAVARNFDKLYYKFPATEEELRTLYRPQYKITKNIRIPIKYREPKPSRPGRRHLKPIDSRTALSAQDHRVVLFEFIERMPPCMNKIGMATRINNYFKKRDSRIQPQYEDGVLNLIDKSTALPLLGKLVENQLFTSTENNLYSAQIHPHDPHETDFLLVSRRDDDGKNSKFYIREIPRIYAVGHTQSQLEVPDKSNRVVRQFVQSNLNLYITKRLRELEQLGEEQVIHKSEIEERFPTISKSRIKTQLQKFCTFTKKVWTAQKEIPLQSEQELLSPELWCRCEAEQKSRLFQQDNGINEETERSAFGASLCPSLSKRSSRTIRFLEYVVSNTSWETSKNFLGIISGREAGRLELLQVARHNFSSDDLKQLSKGATEHAEKLLQNELSNEITEKQAREILEAAGYKKDHLDRKGTQTIIQEAKNIRKKKLDAKKQKKKEDFRKFTFNEVLRQIFAREAEKLSNGLPYYTDEYNLSCAEITMTRNHREESSSEEDYDIDKMLESDEEILNEEEELNKFIDDTDSDSDAKSIASEEEATYLQPLDQPKRARYYMMRKTKVRLPNGSSKVEVEVIKDPEMVEKYRERMELKKKYRNKKGFSAIFSGLNKEQVFLHGASGKRQLNEKFKRWKRNYMEKKRLGLPPNERKKRKSQASSVEKKVRKKKKKKVEKSALDNVSSVLESVALGIIENPYYVSFTTPVNLEFNPDYLQFVDKPMDMSIVLKKCREKQYKSEKEFLQDIHLIADNCHRYCDHRFPIFTTIADKLIVEVTEQLHLRRYEMEESDYGDYLSDSDDD